MSDREKSGLSKVQKRVVGSEMRISHRFSALPSPTVMDSYNVDDMCNVSNNFKTRDTSCNCRDLILRYSFAGIGGRDAWCGPRSW